MCRGDRLGIVGATNGKFVIGVYLHLMLLLLGSFFLLYLLFPETPQVPPRLLIWGFNGTYLFLDKGEPTVEGPTVILDLKRFCLPINDFNLFRIHVRVWDLK